jgi:flagellar basal body-associated protein FliL
MTDPELEVLPDDRPIFRRDRPARRSSLPVVMVAIIALAAVGYYLWRMREQPPAPMAPAPAAETEPAPQASTEPRIEHPLEAQPATPLPELGESDVPIRDALASLFGRTSFDQLFVPQDLIRHVVATVDNLPRKNVSLRLMPVKPVPGPFSTVGKEGSLAINPDNAARYAPYVRAFNAVDSGKLVAVYLRFYPLFQQAYADLGYPSRYFNDRVFEVIDHLLAAPDARGSIALTQPKVLYEYADPTLQDLSAGQKILVRMGGENEARVKAKLREIRGVLQRG